MKHAMGLKKRVILLTVVVMSALTAILTVVGYTQFSRNVYEGYVKYAAAAVNAASAAFRKYSMGDLVAARSMGEDYDAARMEINTVKNSADIRYLYAVYFEDLDDLASACYVINAKSDEELATGEPIESIYSYMGEKCEEGAFDQNQLAVFRDAIRYDKPGILQQENNTAEYGHLLTCYTVVHDSAGDPVAVLGVDMDINKMHNDRKAYLFTTCLCVAFFAVLSIGIFLFVLDRKVTKPVTALSAGTDSFVQQLKDGVVPEELLYQKVEVSSQDEVYMLAANISSMVDALRSYMVNLKDVMTEKERIGAELNIAMQIQTSMLPRSFPAFPERTEFDIYAVLRASGNTSGNFYDFFLVDKNRLAVVIGDINGTGIPAALLMVITRTLIKNYARLGFEPERVFAETNNQLSESSEGMTTAAFLGILNLSTGVFSYVNGGHRIPLLKHAGGTFEPLPAKDCFVLGSMAEVPFWQQSVRLTQGDLLFFYTKGLTDAENEENMQYSEEHMRQRLNRTLGEVYELKDILELMQEDVQEFLGENRSGQEDTAMMILRYFGI